MATDNRTKIEIKAEKLLEKYPVLWPWHFIEAQKFDYVFYNCDKKILSVVGEDAQAVSSTILRNFHTSDDFLMMLFLDLPPRNLSTQAYGEVVKSMFILYGDIGDCANDEKCDRSLSKKMDPPYFKLREKPLYPHHQKIIGERFGLPWYPRLTEGEIKLSLEAEYKTNYHKCTDTCTCDDWE